MRVKLTGVSGRPLWPALVACTLLSLAWALTMWHWGSPLIDDDWQRAVKASRLLLGGDLAVYADYPEAQMGPLALLVAALFGHLGYVLAVVAMLPAVLALVARTVPVEQVRRSVVLLGGLLLTVPWAMYASTGHLDDALVALGAVGMVAALREDRSWWVPAAFLVAVAGKPTALLLAPLLLLTSRRAAVVAVAGTCLIWLPFVLSDVHGFLAAGKGYAIVWPNSLPDLLGSDPADRFPAWVRPAQFGIGMLLCWAVGRFRSPAAGVAAAFAFRAILEPGGWAAYSTTVILVAVAVDLGRRGRVPWVTLAAFGSYVVAFGPETLSLAESLLRVGLLALVVGLASWPMVKRRDQLTHREPRLTTLSVGRRL